ncbi:hypothetical protein INR49_020082 [Caranx melampygus]|nr:hypothetical protein INR49_020082 [Caranx melampygus]
MNLPVIFTISSILCMKTPKIMKDTHYNITESKPVSSISKEVCKHSLPPSVLVTISKTTSTHSVWR